MKMKTKHLEPRFRPNALVRIYNTMKKYPYRTFMKKDFYLTFGDNKQLKLCLNILQKLDVIEEVDTKWYAGINWGLTRKGIGYRLKNLKMNEIQQTIKGGTK